MSSPTYAVAASSAYKSETVRELREENDWKNDLVLFWLPHSFR